MKKEALDRANYLTQMIEKLDQHLWQFHLGQVTRAISRSEQLKTDQPKKRKGHSELSIMDEDEYEDDEPESVPNEESLFIKPHPELKLINGGLPIYSSLFGPGFNLMIYKSCLEKRIAELNHIFSEL